MKKIVLIIGFICFGYLANAQNPTISQEVKDHIQDRVEAGLNVGIVVGLINGDDVAYYSFGNTASKDGVAVDEHSVFEIGSISKVFTTILLAKKVSNGDMKLSDPISMYLPKEVKIPTRGGKEITLSNLATHTSGLPRMPNNFAPADPLNPFADYSVKQIYEFLSSYELTRDIGEAYEYSNYGMGLLGHILELKTGKTYEQLVIDNIAKPLRMTNTALTFSEAMKTKLAKPHMGTTQVSNWDIITLAGAGGIRSTATDMVAFVKANMGVTKSPIFKALALSHQSTYKNKEDDFEIGLGWHFENNNTIIWHNGQTGGYHSFIGFLKGTQKGVVVLTNSAESLTPLGLNLLGSPTPLQEIKKPLTIAPEILETYVGNYQLAPTFFIEITTKDGKLYGQATGQSPFELFASAEDEFYLNIVKASVSFKKASDGSIESLVLHQNGQNIPGKKVE